ncbi:hypothetical protein KY290_005108 [Solanum tuberosum]|uniref:Uncharacterized protein n=1 Tax=Solanum tuberosum TaxID=4113 RepID=A0ABQ7WEJ0_SOLTU|nr:hypothetical protein KY284_005230 [Solanum tuberosum]KAH0722457.1 hypothetical protein KY289_005501 [Solanum tuberosum]KAH0751849.1 hypothetical protein KY285_004997 [Solanum tuberosum]KAH0778681.1 hypothetical protein KY290_005108 [Solanum tuberosum]
MQPESENVELGEEVDRTGLMTKYQDNMVYIRTSRDGSKFSLILDTKQYLDILFYVKNLGAKTAFTFSEANVIMTALDY